MSKKPHHRSLRICGMHCASCELMLERRLRSVPGIRSVKANHRTGTAELIVEAGQHPDTVALRDVITAAGYTLDDGMPTLATLEAPSRKWMEIGVSLLIVFALWKFLQVFDIAGLAAGTGETLTLGGIFLIGLVAGASSCLAVTGGLLLSVAAKYNEVMQSGTPWERFRPLLHFNAGRLLSYAVLGGAVGFLGRSVALSTRITGVLNIAVAVLMMGFALSMLRVLPAAALPRLPKRLAHRIADLAEHPHPLAPLALGALTFFLPCGFTQSLQLAALASGSVTSGALIMGTFALGTLPSLLGISAVSAWARGDTSRIFLRFAGSLVLVLSLWNLQSGLLLAGVDAAGLLTLTRQTPPPAAAGADPNVTIDPQGRQIISLRVTPYGYEPSSFTIQSGRETWVYANADRGISGCVSMLTAPDFNLSIALKTGENWLGPITNPQSDFKVMCSMGMVWSTVRVLPS